MDDFRYAYAVARINALSARLLDGEFASRMLAAEPDEIPGMLAETALAESFADVETPNDIERGLARELRKTYDLLEKVCPDKEAIRLFRYRYDFHNLKAILKSRATGVPCSDSLVGLGTYDVERLEAAVSESSYRFIPAHLADAAIEALAEYEATEKLDSIGRVCDRSMWRFGLEKARKGREKAIMDLFTEWIDLANIEAFLRVNEFADDPAAFERYYISGGSYELELFMDHMQEDLGLFLDRLATTRYMRHIVTEGLKMWPEDKSFWRLEIASENYLLEYFHRLRHRVFDIAPLLYYLLRKIAETRLIRRVTRCKLIGMPRAQIEERLGYIHA